MMMSCSILFGQNGVEITVNSRGELEDALNGDHGWYPQIKLGQSFGVSKRVDVKAGVTATLDLNGYTLSADNKTYVLNNLGNLTIKDSSTEGTGTIEGRGIYNGSHGSVDDTDLAAILTIESGIFKNTGTNGGAAVYNLGTAYINGGTFYGEYAAIHNRLAVMHIKNVYIIGKTINSYGDFRNSGALYIGENVYFYGKYSEENNGSHSGEFTYLVAKIDNAYYATLQDAINNAKTGETVTLIADCAGDVTVTQALGYAITIDGDDNTFKGTITVDGKSARYETTALTIKNVNFDATEGITYDACIRLGNGTNATRYTNKVTVENCTFTDNDYSSVAVKSYTGGDYNLVVKDCEANGMHSLLQLANVEEGLIVDNCTANTKNGLNLGSSEGVVIKDSEISVQGYAVRIGASSGGASGAITLENNTLKTNNSEGDAVIVVRGNAVTQVDLSMKKNVVSGTTHISGNTAATKIAADENYWDGKEAPVVAEGSAPIVVNSYYADEALENLVRNEMGSIYAFVSSDRIFGDVTTNAIESIKIEIIGKDGNVIGSSTLEKTEHATGFNKQLTWRINLGDDDSDSWKMEWIEGAPSINNMPAKVKLYVDDADVAEAEIRYTADGDGKSPVFAAKTNAEGKINSFIACDGAYNLNNANNVLNGALTEGDNVAILVAGTYDVPTGKNLTITGAVDGVEFDMPKKEYSTIGVHAGLTFNNVIFQYGNYNYVGLAHCTNMVYNDCTFNGQVFLYGTSETFNNCTFNQNSSGAYNVWTYGAKEVAFNGCTFNSAGKSVLIYSEQSDLVNNVTVTDCDFIASSPVEGKAAIEMDSSLTDGINLTIDGETTATGFGSGNVSGNSLWNNKKGNNNDANNDITVVVDGETVLEPIYVAKIGEEGHRTLQEAIGKAVAGDNTIQLLANIEGDVTILQQEGINIVIDGKNYTFNGTINIYGNARHTGEETLTIQNVNFYTEDNARYFIEANEYGQIPGTNNFKQYAHNVTVENCNFATSAENTENEVVGMRFRQAYNVSAVNCTSDGIFSIMWTTAVDGLTLNGVEATNCEEGITIGGASEEVEIIGTIINSETYAIRAEGAGSDFTIENSTLVAKVPVVVRSVTDNSKISFTFDGTNTITKDNPAGYWFVAGKTEYKGGENEQLPETAGQVSVTLKDTNLNREGIYGSALNGEGTENNPYLIETVNDLVFFREKVNGGNNYAGKHVKLAADIDLSSIENWTPIGDITYNGKYQPADSTKVFSGVFNGNDKVISNLKIEKIIDEDPDTDANVGLFGITGKGAVIKNLTLTNVDIKTSGRNVGALAGFAYMATLDNITVNGDIKIEGGHNVSGVAGMTRYHAMSATNIKVVGNDGSTIVGKNIVGGIFAEIAPNGSEQTFKNLSVENVAITGASGVGGIVGLLTLGTVEDVTVKNVALTGNTLYQGNTMGRIRLGSVSGLMGSTHATIKNVTTENVTAKNLEGTEIEDLPIIGANYGAATNATEARIGDTYYATLKKAIEAAVSVDNTIQLLADITGDVTVTQKEGINIVIDGKNYQFDGTIYIEGNSRNTGAEKLTIQNVNFYTENPSHDFISANSTDSDKRYAHNVTVKDCNFATSEENTNNAVVGMRFRQAYNITVENCKSDGIFSIMWGTAVEGLALNEVELTNCSEGITIAGASKNVTITESEIVSPTYGIRASVEGGQFTMTNSTINALVPVVVRNDNGITNLDQYTLSFTFEETNTITESNPTNYWFVAGETEYKGTSEEMPTAPKGNIIVNLNDNGLSYDGVYGNFAVAKIGDVQYLTFEAALNAVQDGETITVLNVEGSESSKEIEFTKDIEFTITGEAPNYALPVVTFQNATVNISNAEILIPELDARQEATINVIDSKVYDAGGNSIAKSYFNGAINISGTSEVYMMQVTTMGYINISDTAKLHATWQTNVYGNGLITLNNGATFATAGLNLIAKDYEGRDNTDADRVGKPAEIVVDGANFTVGKVYSASGADYSYNADGYGINVGTIEGKSAILTIKNGGNVNIYTGNGKTANIGADGTVNIDASTFNVECRAENGTATLANNGTVNVTGEASINIKKLTDNALNFTDVTIADAYIGGAVNAFGTNKFTGETNVTGIFSVGYNNASAAPVVVNVTGNFNGGNVLIGSSNEHVLNVGNAEGTETTAHFGQLGAFGDVNINNADVTYQYAFIRNDFNVINSTMEVTHVNTYIAGNAEVVVDNSTWNAGAYARIGEYDGMFGNANVTLMNGSVMTATNLNIILQEGKTVKVTIEDNSRLEATNLTNQGSIVLADVYAKVTSNEFDNVPTTSVAYHKVNYVEGSYVVVAKDYVAQIYDVNNNTNDDRRYESLAEAATAAQDGETIQLLWNEGDAAISMNASFFGKNVTITGDAKVDWSKGWFFVGRGGEGDATVTFEDANLTSAKTNTNSGFGIHVSGREKDSDNKYDGTLVIKNDSNIELDYLIDRGAITIDNATLTVTNGFGIAGRPASETEGNNPATATISLENGAKLIVNNHNGMGVGQAAEEPEGYGIMNIDATSTFETTQSFLVTVNGTMNVNGGNVKVAGNLTNKGTMVVAAESNVEVTGDLNVNGTLNSAGNITANIVKEPTATIQLTGGIYTTEPQDGWCAENYGAFPYDENSWVVREISGEQTFELTAGWNWMSSYISEFDTDGLTWLKEDLSEQVGAQIKNNLHAVTNYEQGWFGSLTNVSVKEMYKVKATADATFTHEGSYVNYDECEIVLYPGWNYISYPVNEEMNLIDALAKLQPSSNDIIKTQDATATYVFGAWRGDLTTLTPGQGYMYKNASDEIKSFYYTTKKTTSTDSNNRSSKYWTVDATQYPSNMTMIAMTDVEGGDYEVAAFVNGELRGSSRPVYVEELDAHILILTISGDEVAEVTFKYYDIATGEEVAFSNRINYSSDAVVGSIAEPYMLTRGTTGIGEAEMSQVNIYPNPTTTGTEINLQATCDKVEVFNALGAKVAEYQNVDTIDALETAGIYVIRITNNGNVQNCRLVVK